MADQPLYLTREQVRQVDRIAQERFAVPGIVLMENAARAVAAAAEEMLASLAPSSLPRPAASSPPPPILILCGGGNNGGDGLAAARHLANRGHRVHIALTLPPEKYTGDALTNYRIIEAMGLPVTPWAASLLVPSSLRRPTPSSLPPALLIDAIFGTGLAQPPRPPFEEIAAAISVSGLPVLAVDLPSGLDADTGLPFATALRATRTVTFAALKQGFQDPLSRQWTGEVTVADIGCPAAALDLARARATAD